MPDDITNHESAEGYLHSAGDIQNGDTDTERTNALLTALVHAVLSLNEAREAPKKARIFGPIRCYGNNVDELEDNALFVCRGAFGASSNLRVVRDYTVNLVDTYGAMYAAAAGKTYRAEISVEVIE